MISAFRHQSSSGIRLTSSLSWTKIPFLTLRGNTAKNTRLTFSSIGRDAVQLFSSTVTWKLSQNSNLSAARRPSVPAAGSWWEKTRSLNSCCTIYRRGAFQRSGKSNFARTLYVRTVTWPSRVRWASRNYSRQWAPRRFTVAWLAW